MTKPYLVIIKNTSDNDNRLRGIRKLMDKFPRITSNVYLVPFFRWNHVRHILPRRGVRIYYTQTFEIIDLQEKDDK